jgi:hypothetical protein
MAIGLIQLSIKEEESVREDGTYLAGDPEGAYDHRAAP